MGNLVSLLGSAVDNEGIGQPRFEKLSKLFSNLATFGIILAVGKESGVLRQDLASISSQIALLAGTYRSNIRITHHALDLSSASIQ